MDSKGIIQLKLAGIVYKSPWSQAILFQHNDPDAYIGFNVLDRKANGHCFRIVFEGKEAYIMQWDAGEFFERPA